MKPSKCKNPTCGAEYEKRNISHRTCSLKCALELATLDRKRKQAREHREAKVKARTRSEWLKLTQAAVNKFIRMRDGNLCISCGRLHQGQIHAGHYMSVGAHPELRFHEDNIHSQCSACNNYLSGNIVNYRKGLIAKIGIEKVHWLEGKHEPKKYTIPDLIAIRAEYVRKGKEVITPS